MDVESWAVFAGKSTEKSLKNNMEKNLMSDQWDALRFIKNNAPSKTTGEPRQLTF